MGFRRTDQLSDIIKLRTSILVICNTCNHQSHVNPADMVEALGTDKEVVGLTFHCDSCGSSSVRITPDRRNLVKARK